MHTARRSGRRAALVSLGTLALLGITAGCSREARVVRGQPVPAGATVLAFGDSLTWGTGAPREAAWPTLLARETGWNVVNAGVPGDTSSGALARLPALLEQHRPALVLVGIGGNDFLRRMNEAETEANLRRIAEAARAAGAQVLLIAVPRPTLAARVTGSLSDHPMYAEVAEALRLPLHANGWSTVLADEALRADAIHANAAGYERFARGLLDTLRASNLR